tara:strand:- start:4043 stop:4891 length:849 start_codon:yes stop_codon:yes gene_type:complete
LNPIYLQALSFHDIYGNSDDCIHAAADLAAELGIAGIDIEDRLLASFEPDYLHQLAHQIEGKGVQIGYCGLIVQFTEPVSSIPDEIDRAKALIDAMPDLGVDAIRIPGNGVVDDQTLEFTFDAVKAKLLTICEYAADAGINVYLHNHNHGSTPSTGAQVLKMLDEIDNPALSYVVDTGQFQGSPGAGGFGSPDNGAQPELYESIEMVVPRASMSRTKFYFANNGDEQWLDYPRIVRIFKKANFTGPLSIVYEPRGKLLSKDALPKAVKYLTELMQKDLYTLR